MSFDYVKNAAALPRDSRDVTAVQRLILDPIFVAHFDSSNGVGSIDLLLSSPAYRPALYLGIAHHASQYLIRQVTGQYSP